jgi:chromosome segregation ATPase
MQANIVTPIQTAAISLQHRVFDTCDKLWESTDGQFTNNDVLSISKGGIAAVGRLVKVYRANRKIVEANKALNSDVSITLVHALNDLLESQKAVSQQAVADFLATTANEMTELSNLTESQSKTIEAQREELQQLKGLFKALEIKHTQQQATQDELQRTYQETEKRLALTQGELTHTQRTHALKLEQLNSEYQTHLARSLEEQRKSLTGEHQDTINAIQQQHQPQLEEANGRSAQYQEEKRALQRTNDSLEHQLHKITLAHESMQEKSLGLELLIEEKQEAMQHARKENRQLIESMKQQLGENTDAVTDQLRSVSSSADAAQVQISDMVTLLAELRTAANNLKTKE